jgi:hypothetical protein
VLALGAQAGAVAALLLQLGFDCFPRCFGFRRFELGEEAVDPRVGVLQEVADVDGGGGDVGSGLVAGADLVDRREGGEGIAEPGAGDQQLEAGGGDAGLALAGGRADDDAVVGVDCFEDLGRIVCDVDRGGAEDQLGGAFDCAVLEADAALGVATAAVEAEGARAIRCRGRAARGRAGQASASGATSSVAPSNRVEGLAAGSALGAGAVPSVKPSAPPDCDWLSVSLEATTAAATAIARIATPPAGISRRRGFTERKRVSGSRVSRERRGKPAAARPSSSAANSGRGVGRSARRSAAS